MPHPEPGTPEWDRTIKVAQLWVQGFKELVVEGVRNGLDLGDLISAGLAEAAQDLGGVSHVIAGRPGSWEAQHLLHLAHGKLGDNDRAMNVRPFDF